MSKVIDRDSKGQPIKYGVYRQVSPKTTRNVYLVTSQKGGGELPKLLERPNYIPWLPHKPSKLYESIAVDLTRKQAYKLRYASVQMGIV